MSKVLQVGDVVYTSYSGKWQRRQKIERITATMATLPDGTKLRVRDGKLTGSSVGADAYDMRSYCIETPDRKAEFDELIKRNPLIKICAGFKYFELPLSKLQRIVDILNEGE